MGQRPPLISRHFVDVGGREVHYRRCGAGPVVVMLHPTPSSSECFVDTMEALANQFTVIAPDRPGYGDSDRLPCAAPEISDYAMALRDTVDALGLERFLLFGRATGSLEALEFAHCNPGRLSGLTLENLALVPDEARELFLARMYPPIELRHDGGHLLALWSMWRDFSVFYPWFDHASRIDADMPSPAELQAGLMSILRAGPGYELAARAVFRYYARPVLATLTTPTALVYNLSFPLARRFRDGLPSLPPSVALHDLPDHAPARVEALRAIFGGMLPPRGGAPPAPPMRSRPGAGRIARGYCALAGAQLLVRTAGSGGRRPLLMLHDAFRSGASLEPLMRAFGENHLIVAPDLPGCGDSDSFDANDWTAERLADAAAEILDRLAIATADVYGVGTGAAVTVELARRHGSRVGRVVLDRAAMPSPSERVAVRAHPGPALQPTDDGAHLIAAWSFVNDSHRYWPWFSRTRATRQPGEEPSTAALHAEVIELLKTRAEAMRGAHALRQSAGGRLPAHGGLLCVGPGERFERLARRAARVAPQIEIARMAATESPAALAAAIERATAAPC